MTLDPSPLGDAPADSGDLTDERIAEIDARVDAATPGPWKEYRPNVYAYLGGPDAVPVGTFKFGSGDEAAADRALTVNAREDLAALLADNKRLRGRVAFWETAAQRNGELYAGAENQRDDLRNPLSFGPVDPSPLEDAPDDTAYECSCANPDDQYLLEIDEGSVSIVHKACGKPPRGDDWWHDTLSLGKTPVTLTAEPYGNCNGSEWHGEHRCDCGTNAVLTIQPAGQVVAIELVFQVRSGADEPWRDNGQSIPGMFIEDAERLLKVHRRAWPDKEHRVVRRTTTATDEVLP